MHLVYRQSCRVCGSRALTPVIDLGEQYLQGAFIKENYVLPPRRKLPTRLVRCNVTQDERGCGLLQMAHTPPAGIIYVNYWYRSGTNTTMRQHLAGIVHEALAIRGRDQGRALDIGCNDGTLLSFYPESFERFGVDPSDISREIPPPTKVINTLFPSEMLLLALADKPMDIITSIAMFYDLENPLEFSGAIKRILAPQGIWILEMSYLPLMLLTNAFDTICHEHLEYYSLSVLENIMDRAGLRIFRAELNNINGGSIRCYVGHNDNFRYDTTEKNDQLQQLRIREFELELDTDRPYLAFQERIGHLKHDTRKLLTSLKDQGKTIHVYGASTKGNVILQWYGIDRSIVDYAADRNPHKDGAKTLGTEIPIVNEQKSRDMHPDFYLVLPWHFKKEFLERERKTLEAGTRMIFPLPNITVIDIDNLDNELRKLESQSTDIVAAINPEAIFSHFVS